MFDETGPESIDCSQKENALIDCHFDCKAHLNSTCKKIYEFCGFSAVITRTQLYSQQYFQGLCVIDRIGLALVLGTLFY